MSKHQKKKYIKAALSTPCPDGYCKRSRSHHPDCVECIFCGAQGLTPPDVPHERDCKARKSAKTGAIVARADTGSLSGRCTHCRSLIGQPHSASCTVDDAAREVSSGTDIAEPPSANKYQQAALLLANFLFTEYYRAQKDKNCLVVLTASELRKLQDDVDYIRRTRYPNVPSKRRLMADNVKLAVVLGKVHGLLSAHRYVSDRPSARKTAYNEVLSLLEETLTRPYATAGGEVSSIPIAPKDYDIIPSAHLASMFVKWYTSNHPSVGEELSQEDIAALSYMFGVAKHAEAAIRGYEKCPACDGKGHRFLAVVPPHPVRCSFCGGTGKQPLAKEYVVTEDLPKLPPAKTHNCLSCGAAGDKFPLVHSPDCRAAGYSQKGTWDPRPEDQYRGIDTCVSHGPCPVCNGEGVELKPDIANHITCRMCKGTGKQDRLAEVTSSTGGTQSEPTMNPNLRHYRILGGRARKSELFRCKGCGNRSYPGRGFDHHVGCDVLAEERKEPNSIAVGQHENLQVRWKFLTREMNSLFADTHTFLMHSEPKKGS